MAAGAVQVTVAVVDRAIGVAFTADGLPGGVAPLAVHPVTTRW